ncbi:LacI family DNA-binding transcriptional regulator [Brochothrix thermosphacta]|uniref:LacI family DNA-binding transcriptional regulator n=1 Tax=Brochothrix thermosphacta TaxID=2756 RepID=UPI0003E8A6DD|nr:LacI family DNA-binding transcriptional regulator [Brochothrix thermosphacta]EUJ34442.1 sucrose operon repressor ScrR [Brochothrix thermosphacta DSM 20171 = FSL F6-1036]ODJ48588.1 LacI family transcriptional regulator [Brochothrix thermosphacta DSM 20171 = FSL F6-1036]
MVVKLTDVAELAGVSATTVSRVINNYGYLSKKTIDKVHSAMRELNYQPNSLARSLQGKSTMLIGLVFPSVRHPFYGELIENLERKLFAKGYKVILCDSEKDPEKEREYLRMLSANQVDGVIAGSHNLNIDEYQNVTLPIISFDRFLAPGIPIVSSNNFEGGKAATEALIARGAKNIAIITGANDTASPSDYRFDGYKAVMDAQNLETNGIRLKSDSSELLKQIEIEKLLKDESIDGIFCTDDLTAVTVINIATRIGINVPTDLKVVGYDGTKLLHQLAPYLSTVVQPIDEMCDVMIELLMKRIEDADVILEETYSLPARVALSESC